jgi:superfamily II DNA or RNA helicase
LAIKEGKVDPSRFLDIPDLDTLWADTESDQTKQRGLLVLSWLVARGTLSVRFSIRPKGIHHDKFAFFRDSDGSEIVVHGTNNETQAANVPEFNYESLSVFRNWEPDFFERHGEYKLREFLRLWEGNSKSALSVEAPNPLLEKIAYLAENQAGDPKFLELFQQLKKLQEHQEGLPRIPIFWGDQRYGLFPHQKEAVNAYIDNDYKGIFALATGSGKTITALHAATDLSRQIAIENSVDVFIVVAVPYQILADQWVENFTVFGCSAIRAYGSVNQWFESLSHAVSRAAFEPAPRVTAIVVVNRTLQSDAFQGLIRQVSPQQVIFIGDECHRLGSIIDRQKCPQADYKMGLSATPWAPHEERLRESLLSYFERPIAEYGLAEAFEDKVLVPYRYFLTEVSLSELEGETYAEHTAEIKRLSAIKLDGGEINDDVLNFHRNQRAAVIGSAEQKFAQLPKLLGDVKAAMGLQHLLVYCGSGSSEDDDAATGSIRDIENAQMISAEAVGLQSARVTAKESPIVRQGVLRAFRAGSLAAVFAIKVLDEGFDMPGVRGAILLASSRNERQFIQRRGRVLRTAQGKEQAFIWDFLVSGHGVMPPGYAKELTEMELLRCIEFSRLSLDHENQEEYLRLYSEGAGCDFDTLFEKVISSRYEANSYE